MGLERNLECCVANVCSRSDTLARLSLTSVTAAPPQHLCVSSASSAPFFPLFFKSPRCCIHIPLFLPPVFSHCSHSSVCVSLPPPPPPRTTFVRLCLSAVFFLDGMIHYAFLYTPRIWHRLIFIYIYISVCVCVCT